MARPLRIAYPGAIYHVTARGNERKEIFKSQRDREKFLDYLGTAAQRYGAVIHVYCLMTNHYHLLLETPVGNVSQIMRHINGGYTTYFNVKRKRAGHLFQGRYKAVLVEADAYAAVLSRYIHLNPVRAGMVAKPDDYPWSSYRNYLREGPASEWLKTDFILGYFSGSEEAYRTFVEAKVGADDASPLQGAIGGAILGREAFVEKIAAQHVARSGPQREVPALRQLISRPSPDAILRVVGAALGGNAKLARQAGMYLCHRYSGEKIREIGALFGVGPSAVTEASRNFAIRTGTDRGLAGMVENIKAELKI